MLSRTASSACMEEMIFVSGFEPLPRSQEVFHSSFLFEISRNGSGHPFTRKPLLEAKAPLLLHKLIPVYSSQRKLIIWPERPCGVTTSSFSKGHPRWETTIGRIIALSQVCSGWEAIECRNASEVLRQFVADRRQVFVADDFFGRTEYEPMRVTEWQSELAHILPLLGQLIG